MEDIIRRLRILIEGKGRVESSRNNRLFPFCLAWELLWVPFFSSLLYYLVIFCDIVKNNRQVKGQRIRPLFFSKNQRKKKKAARFVSSQYQKLVELAARRLQSEGRERLNDGN